MLTPREQEAPITERSTEWSRKLLDTLIIGLEDLTQRITIDWEHNHQGRVGSSTWRAKTKTNAQARKLQLSFYPEDPEKTAPSIDLSMQWQAGNHYRIEIKCGEETAYIFDQDFHPTGKDHTLEAVLENVLFLVRNINNSKEAMQSSLLQRRIATGEVVKTLVFNMNDMDSNPKETATLLRGLLAEVERSHGMTAPAPSIEKVIDE